MDHDHARKHLKIMNLRVISLEKELKAALRDNRIAEERKKIFQDGFQTCEANKIDRIRSLESKYGLEIEEYEKQIRLANEVLAKKKEERQAMIDYLISLNLLEQSYDELRSFDWNSLQRLIENLNKPNPETVEVYNKVAEINELCDIARKHIDEIAEQIASVEILAERFKNTAKIYQGYLVNWKKLKEHQDKRYAKIQCDNQKLNLLLKQCVASNAPLSEYVTRTVHAKCQSFIYCDPDSSELLNGLRKFKNRQDRIIELLRHKDAKLGSETNKLQVARDQTHDQLRFYSQLIEQQRNAALNKSRINQIRAS